jgi:PEP-CTERM motif
MNICSKLSTLGAALVLTTAFASADTIAINSQAGSTVGVDTIYTSTTATGTYAYTGNEGTSFQLNNVTVNNTWAAPLGSSQWVGIAPTAGPENTVNPAFGVYTFTYDLGSNLVGYYGSIDVLADDTTEVWLNGTELEADGGGTDVHCESAGISCLKSFNIGLPGAATFVSGDNVLTFKVLQAGGGPAGGKGDPSGLDFSGSISPIPEPSTLLMLGTGLLGSAGALFRRMRA